MRTMRCTFKTPYSFLDVDCGKLPSLPYGSAGLLNGTTHLGSVIQYSCTTNYRLVGPVRRICNDEHQWSDSSPRCEGTHLKSFRHKFILCRHLTASSIPNLSLKLTVSSYRIDCIHYINATKSFAMLTTSLACRS